MMMYIIGGGEGMVDVKYICSAKKPFFCVSGKILILVLVLVLVLFTPPFSYAIVCPQFFWYTIHPLYS